MVCVEVHAEKVDAYRLLVSGDPCCLLIFLILIVDPLLSDKTLVLDLDQTLVHSTLTIMNKPDFTMEINVPESGLHTVYVKVSKSEK